MAKYQSGNTIMFSVEFKDLQGNLVDPELVRFKVYDDLLNPLEDVDILLDPNNKIAVGRYTYNYTTGATDVGAFYVEWYGEVNTVPTLQREEFTLGFI